MNTEGIKDKAKKYIYFELVCENTLLNKGTKIHSPWFVTAQSQEHFDSFLNPDDCCCSVSNLLHHCKTATITKLACLFFITCLATFVHWEMVLFN